MCVCVGGGCVHNQSVCLISNGGYLLHKSHIVWFNVYLERNDICNVTLLDPFSTHTSLIPSPPSLTPSPPQSHSQPTQSHSKPTPVSFPVHPSLIPMLTYLKVTVVGSPNKDMWYSIRRGRSLKGEQRANCFTASW